MKIIILGAGQVGGTLAENLVSEDNDITVIDNDQDRLNNLQDKFDLRVILGNASSPRVLREAGAADADMLVAVTSSDETNMVASQVAYTLFGTPSKIARIREHDYIREKEKLFQPDIIPIDQIIAPEKLVIDDIARLIDYPGALQIAYFAEGKISLVAVKPSWMNAFFSWLVKNGISWRSLQSLLIYVVTMRHRHWRICLAI